MGIRAGQGYGEAKPKRLPCPQCSKKGVTRWRVIPGSLVRHCQYCQASWGEDGWAVASGQKTQSEVTAELLDGAAMSLAELEREFAAFVSTQGKQGAKRE